MRLTTQEKKKGSRNGTKKIDFVILVTIGKLIKTICVSATPKKIRSISI